MINKITNPYLSDKSLIDSDIIDKFNFSLYIFFYSLTNYLSSLIYKTTQNNKFSYDNIDRYYER